VDTEVTGPVAFYFNATLDQPDATWIATLRDVASDGSSRVLTKGWLRASQRALDTEKSTHYRPRQLHSEKETLEPGHSYFYAMEIREVSNLFKAGHCLVLDVRGQDSTAEDPIWVHTCNAVPTKHVVQFGGTHQSHLLLPIIPSSGD
jgi:predicted acyl esterase